MRSPKSTTRRGLARCAPLAAVALALAACGGGTSGSGSGGVAGTTAPAGAGKQVVVTESEYRLQLSTTRLIPGTATFVAVNKGRVAHSLEIDGPGVSDKRIAGTIAPGGTMRLTVTLQKGSYEIYCPVDGHKQLGMDTHVTVGGAAGTHMGTETTSNTTSNQGNGY